MDGEVGGVDFRLLGVFVMELVFNIVIFWGFLMDMFCDGLLYVFVLKCCFKIFGLCIVILYSIYVLVVWF